MIEGSSVTLLRDIEADNVMACLDENDNPIPGVPDTITISAGTVGYVDIIDNQEPLITFPGIGGWPHQWVVSLADLREKGAVV